MIRKSLIIFFALILVFFALKTKAQIQDGDILLTINPSHPNANQQVKATVSSISADLNKSNITWMLNGNTVNSGVGKKTFTFTTGSIGTSSEINVSIETTDGSLISKNLSISPGGVDMLWEAYDSYVPPFYKGKTLAVKESRIRVVAIPNGDTIGGLSYNWKQDGDVMQDSSGYGKNSYSFKNSFLEKNNSVFVEVSDLSGDTIGQGSTAITYQNPKILFYKKTTVSGTLWNNALNDGYTINKQGDTIVAEPYFIFPNNLYSSNLNWQWSIADNPITNTGAINEIAIKPADGQNGQSKISILINNTATLFLNITKDLNVNF
ncbi:MAG: hypothetical protein WCI41_00285 [bacterium]